MNPFMIAIYLMLFSAGGVFGYQIINAERNYLANRQLPTAENTQPPQAWLKQARETVRER